jgi:large subunit ribosomal protein L19
MPETATKKTAETRLQEFEKSRIRQDIPSFKSGDTIRVNVRIREGDRERIQAFQGICIARKGGGMRETLTVRKISFGVGVERTFLINSPQIESIKVVREAHVRRAKLYYLRDLVGKKASRLKDKKRVTLEE